MMLQGAAALLVCAIEIPKTSRLYVPICELSLYVHNPTADTLSFPLSLNDLLYHSSAHYL